MISIGSMKPPALYQAKYLDWSKLKTFAKEKLKVKICC